MKNRIYMMGGLYPGWVDEAKVMLPRWEVLESKMVDVKDQKLFIPMGIGLIELSDACLHCVSAIYKGYNHWFEHGWAAHAGKYTVMVIDPLFCESIPERHIDMFLQTSEAVFSDLQEACKHLNEWRFGQRCCGKGKQSKAGTIKVVDNEFDNTFVNSVSPSWDLQFAIDVTNESIVADIALHTTEEGCFTFYAFGHTYYEAVQKVVNEVDQDGRFVLDDELVFAFVRKALWFDEKQPKPEGFVTARLEKRV